MSPEELAAKRGDVTLLDVRSADELMVACLDGDCLNIPLDELPARWAEIPQNKPIAVLCHHGVRSQKAANFLAAQGLDAHSVVGGIDAWSRVVDASVPRY